MPENVRALTETLRDGETIVLFDITKIVKILETAKIIRVYLKKDTPAADEYKRLTDEEFISLLL